MNELFVANCQKTNGAGTPATVQELDLSLWAAGSGSGAIIFRTPEGIARIAIKQIKKISLEFAE